MNITHKWSVVEIERQAIDDYVTRIHWEVVATLDEDDSISSRSIGVSAFNQTKYPSVVSFNEITEELALSWVFTIEDKALIEESLTKRIEDIVQPKTITGKPW